MISELEKEARRLVDSGISVIPVKADGTKAPAVHWKDYQARRAIPGELHKWSPTRLINGRHWSKRLVG
jgi:hypothetical protein